MTRTAGTVPWGRLSRFVSVGALATALVACGGSSGSSTSGSPSSGAGSSAGTSALQGDPTVIVAASAKRTTAAKNAKVDLTGNVSAMGQSFDLTGNGAIDFAGNTFTLNLTIPSTGQLEERLVDDIVYVKVPAQAAGQFGGKPWLKIDPKALGASGGSNPFASLDSSNPAKILSTLQGAGKVTKVADEDVRGVKTVHYRADIDVAKAAEAQGFTAEQKQQLQQSLGGQATLPEDVWLDEQGLVRRVAVDITATPPTTGTSSSAPTSLKTKFQMEFYDYGQAGTAVTPPPADQTTDFSQLLSQLGQLGTGTPG